MKDLHDPALGLVRIVLIDDHPILLHGLSRLIDQEDDLVVCGAASSGREGMAQIDSLQPDLVVLDISLPEINGLQVIKSLRARKPELRILVLSMHDEALYAERALRAGARGYVMKQEAPDMILTAIRRVVKGDIWVSGAIASKLLRMFAGGRDKLKRTPFQRLSDRELEVLRLLGHGQTTRHIAGRLHLSIKTIHSYREHLKSKLGLCNASELVQFAVRWVHSQELG